MGWMEVEVVLGALSLSLFLSLTDIWVQKMSEIILVEAMGDGLW